MVKMFKNRKFC